MFFLTPQSAYERWSSMRLVASNREADMEPQGIYTRSNPNYSFTLNGVPCVFSTEEMQNGSRVYIRLCKHGIYFTFLL